MTIRERIYKQEALLLSPYAAHCANTKGRLRPEEEGDLRTEYMRDRDRIIHCKAFRRMKDKTQVFLYPDSSHYRTRLTHTMEVSQIARTIAKALSLNEDLTEAIALGHDLGHTPFGHAGERALDTILPFSHNEQSIRVVTMIEKNGMGLNLTHEVLDGILNHKKSLRPETLEGMAVNFSDRIAYLNHDIDDAIRAGILKNEDLPKACTEILGETHSRRIGNMINDIVCMSEGKNCLMQSDAFARATELLRDFMFSEVYTNPYAKAEEKKVDGVIARLFEYYIKNLSELPNYIYRQIEKEGKERCVADYIAGMTDAYIISRYAELYVPKGWNPIQSL